MKPTIPDKETRIKQSKEITDKMYGPIWNKIMDELRLIEPEFASIIEEIPYGSIFPREGLELKYKQIASITALTTLNLKSPLKSHLIAAMNLGLTKQEIVEIFLHISMFIGFPLVLDAILVAKDVFNKFDV